MIDSFLKYGLILAEYSSFDAKELKFSLLLCITLKIVGIEFCDRILYKIEKINSREVKGIIYEFSKISRIRTDLVSHVFSAQMKGL